MKRLSYIQDARCLKVNVCELFQGPLLSPCLSASREHKCQNGSYNSNAILIPEEKNKVYIHIYVYILVCVYIYIYIYIYITARNK